MEILRGIDLINKIIEFKAMTPDQSTWHPHLLKSNPPRYVRFKQIQSMISAFLQEDTSLLTKLKSVFTNEKKTDIQSILSGNFIRTNPGEKYKEALEFIEMTMKRQGNDFDIQKEMQIAKLGWLFSDLLRYKESIYNLLTHNSGWIEGGRGVMLYGIFLTNSISKNLVGKYDELDEILELIINPEKLSFSETELISKYRYPKQNLQDLDFEWS